MGKDNQLLSVTINLDGTTVKMEQLPLKEGGQAMVRISCWSKELPSSRPLEITERNLIVLLQQGIREGVLSPEFLSDLRAEFVI